MKQQHVSVKISELPLARIQEQKEIVMILIGAAHNSGVINMFCPEHPRYSGNTNHAFVFVRSAKVALLITNKMDGMQVGLAKLRVSVRYPDNTRPDRVIQDERSSEMEAKAWAHTVAREVQGDKKVTQIKETKETRETKEMTAMNEEMEVNKVVKEVKEVNEVKEVKEVKEVRQSMTVKEATPWGTKVHAMNEMTEGGEMKKVSNMMARIAALEELIGDDDAWKKAKVLHRLKNLEGHIIGRVEASMAIIDRIQQLEETAKKQF